MWAETPLQFPASFLSKRLVFLELGLEFHVHLSLDQVPGSPTQGQFVSPASRKRKVEVLSFSSLWGASFGK